MDSDTRPKRKKKEKEKGSPLRKKKLKKRIYLRKGISDKVAVVFKEMIEETGDLAAAAAEEITGKEKTNKLTKKKFRKRYGKRRLNWQVDPAGKEFKSQNA